MAVLRDTGWQFTSSTGAQITPVPITSSSTFGGGSNFYYVQKGDDGPIWKLTAYNTQICVGKSLPISFSPDSAPSKGSKIYINPSVLNLHTHPFMDVYLLPNGSYTQSPRPFLGYYVSYSVGAGVIASGGGELIYLNVPLWAALGPGGPPVMASYADFLGIIVGISASTGASVSFNIGKITDMTLHKLNP